MITIKQGVGIFLFITSATAVILFVLVQNNRKPNLSVSFASLPMNDTSLPTTTPTHDTINKSIMDSPEGSQTLTLESLDTEGKTDYSLYVSLKSDDSKQKIYSKKGSITNSLSVPFNTWSSDNSFVFLKDVSLEQTDYLVFQSSGNVFSNDLSYISVQEYFQKKVQNYIIEDVTGWAGPNLLVVNTKSTEGDKKVSFWFDLTSLSFIQLGTYFR